MITVHIKINNEEIAMIKAVRISPVNKTPKDGEMCTYNLSANGKGYAFNLMCPYGNANRLAVSMLNAYENEEHSE